MSCAVKVKRAVPSCRCRAAYEGGIIMLVKQVLLNGLLSHYDSQRDLFLGGTRRDSRDRPVAALTPSEKEGNERHPDGRHSFGIRSHLFSHFPISFPDESLNLPIKSSFVAWCSLDRAFLVFDYLTLLTPLNPLSSVGRREALVAGAIPDSQGHRGLFVVRGTSQHQRSSSQQATSNYNFDWWPFPTPSQGNTSCAFALLEWDYQQPHLQTQPQLRILT